MLMIPIKSKSRIVHLVFVISISTLIAVWWQINVNSQVALASNDRYSEAGITCSPNRQQSTSQLSEITVTYSLCPAQSTFDGDFSLLSQEQLLKPLPPQDPKYAALLKGKLLLGEGDRLLRDEHKQEAYLSWEAAAKAFHDAGNRERESFAYLQLADFLMRDAIFKFDIEKARLAIDYAFKSAQPAVAEYETLIKKDLPFDKSALAQGDSLLNQALVECNADHYSQAIQLFRKARHVFQQAKYSGGEAHVLFEKAHCQLERDALFDLFFTMIDTLGVVQELPMGTSTDELYLKGREQFDQGNLRDALQTFEKVLPQWSEENDANELVAIYLALAATHVELRKYDQAKEWYGKAQYVVNELLHDECIYYQALIWHGLGVIEFETGQFENAYSYFAQAIPFWQESGRPFERVASLNGLGITLYMQGRSDEAIQVIRQALATQLQLSPNNELESYLYNNLGAVYFSIGDFQHALSNFERAQQLLQESVLISQQMRIWNNIATVQMITGSPERAADAFRKIHAFAQTSNDRPLELLALFNEANLYLKQGQYQKAITMYLNVLPSLDLKDTRWLEALVLQNLGSAYLQIGDLRNAEVYLEQAGEKFKQLGHQGYVSQVQMNLGTLAYLAAQWDRAEVYYQAALSIAREREDAIITSQVLINLAVLSATQHDFSRALGYAKQAHVLVVQSEDRFSQVKILTTLSMIELALLDWQAATKYAERSLALAHKLNDPMTKVASQSVLALTALMNGKRDEAVHGIQSAIDILENLQGYLTLSEFKTTFLGQAADIYALAAFIAIQDGQLDQAFYFTEQSRARAFLDQIGRQPIKLNQSTAPEIVTQTMTIRQEIIHLESSLHIESTKPLEQQQAGVISDWKYALEAKQQEYTRLFVELKATNPKYALLVSTDSLTLRQVQEQALTDKTTLIVYFTVDDLMGKQTFAWVIDREMAKLVTLKISQHELQTKVEFLRRTIETRTVSIEDSTVLYDDIVAPLEPYIRHKNIIIVPHGVLHYLPFAALFDAHKTQYLIENYTISYAPSASAIPLLSSKQNPFNGMVLALGNADGSLPYAADEVKMATSFYAGRSFIGKQATEENLYDEMDTADILHLAVHSHYNQISPLFSRLELAPTSENDGYWEIHEIYESDLRNTDLVILSACDTSLGEFSKGDEIINLSRAFFYAGVPTVVSTLWAIDDEATAMLMESFYRHLKNGMTIKESLQSAQREISSQEKWHSPYFWAGFVLTGDTYRYAP